MAATGKRGDESEAAQARSMASARKRLYTAYNGYVRVPNPRRLANGRSGETGRKGSYKKGWELRLVVPADELEQARELIVRAGLNPARPFVKGKQIIQPIYGYQPVTEFLEARGGADEVLRARRNLDN